MRRRSVLLWGMAVLFASACSSGGDAASDGPLAIERVSPQSGDFRSELRVTVTGTGFSSEAHVFFGASEATVVSRSRRSLEVTLPARGRPGRVPVVVRDGSAQVTASDLFGFRAMEPEELLFVDSGVVAPGAESAAFQGDLDGDGKSELVLAGDASARVVQGNLARGFSDFGTVDGRVLGVGRLGSSSRASVFVASSTGLEAARFDGDTFARSRVEGIARADLLAIKHGATNDEVVVVGTNLAGERGLFSLVASGDAVTSVQTLALGAFESVSAALEDVDGDGATDVLLGGRDAGPRLLRGDGHGAFLDAPAGTFPGSHGGRARVADLDVDGNLDVVVETAAGELALVAQGTRFADRTAAIFAGAQGTTVAFADLDEDGAIDRIAAGPGVIVHRNDGVGRFFDYTARAAAAVRQLHPIGVADLDGDGDLDLLATDAGGRVHALENWAPRARKDGDRDGIPDERDVCPDKADPDQRDSDSAPFSCLDAADCAAQTGCTLTTAAEGRWWLVCPMPKPFDEARAFCAKRGAKLALPHTADEGRALGTAFQRGWIDLSDRAAEGHFVDSAGQPPPYLGWRPNQPDNAGANENCVEIYPDGGWNDLPCNLAIAFACEDTARTPDGHGDACDVCPLLSDPEQTDTDGDGIGDACDPCPAGSCAP